MIESVSVYFKASPIIFMAFTLVIFFSLLIWFFSLYLLKKSPFHSPFIDRVRKLMSDQKSDQALKLCESQKSFCSKIVACAIATQKYGAQISSRAIQAEVMRQRTFLWTQAKLLKKLAWSAFFLGIMGTLLSSFYLFESVNQTQESLASALSQLKISLAPLIGGILTLLWVLFIYYMLQHKLNEFSKNISNEAMDLGKFLCNVSHD